MLQLNSYSSWYCPWFQIQTSLSWEAQKEDMHSSYVICANSIGIGMWNLMVSTVNKFSILCFCSINICNLSLPSTTKLSNAGIYLHDPVCFAALVRPDLFSFKRGVVRVETQGICVGHTLMDQGLRKYGVSCLVSICFNLIWIQLTPWHQPICLADGTAVTHGLAIHRSQ